MTSACLRPAWGSLGGVLSSLTTRTRPSVLPTRPDSSDRAAPAGVGVGVAEGAVATGLDGSDDEGVEAGVDPPLHAASASAATPVAEGWAARRRRGRTVPEEPALGRPVPGTPVKDMPRIVTAG